MQNNGNIAIWRPSLLFSILCCVPTKSENCYNYFTVITKTEKYFNWYRVSATNRTIDLVRIDLCCCFL